MRSNRVRTTVLAATALLAALSLTACSSDDGSGGNNEGAKAGAAVPAAHTAVKPSQPPAPAPAPTQETPETPDEAATGTETGRTPRRTAPPAKSEAKKDTGATQRTGSTPNRTPVTCTGGNTRTTVSKVSRPVNHLLLTLTNTGNRPCYAYYAPMLRFDDAQAVFQILGDSRPQAVVTIDPGESAYAGIALTGEPNGQKPFESKHLGVTFADRANAPVNSAPAELTLPGKTYWDDNGFVTYWQTEMADALTY